MEFELKEFVIAVVAKNNNPTILNPDFLKINGIVPKEWRAAGPVLCTEPVAHVPFENGVSVVAQLEKLIFSQKVDGKPVEEILVSSIAEKYLRVLPHVDYRAFGVNPKGHVEFESIEEARAFVTDRLIADGPWREMNGHRAFASCKLAYRLDDVLLTVNIDVAAWPVPNREPVPVVTFGGNFHREIPGVPGEEKVEKFCGMLQDWKSDLASFQSLVEGQFLTE